MKCLRLGIGYCVCSGSDGVTCTIHYFYIKYVNLNQKYDYKELDHHNNYKCIMKK